MIGLIGDSGKGFSDVFAARCRGCKIKMVCIEVFFVYAVRYAESLFRLDVKFVDDGLAVGVNQRQVVSIGVQFQRCNDVCPRGI